MHDLPTDLPETGVPLAVRTRGLRKRFGRSVALDGLDLAVPEGSVYVLVGPNGAGKTTTLKVLLDLVVADAGTAEVFGLDTRADGARVRARIGYVPERDEAAYGWLRVGALLRYHAAYYPTWDAGYATELADLFELRPGARLAELSKGQQRRVQLVMALAHRPPLLLLDEPTDGLDPVMRGQTLAALAGHLARFPTTIVVSTHHVDETERLGDHLGILRGGRMTIQLTRDALHRRLRRYRIQVPDGWTPGAALEAAAVRRDGTGREVAWTIWGEQTEVVGRLNEAGATVHRVETLTLADAALALLELPTPASPPTADQLARPIPAGV